MPELYELIKAAGLPLGKTLYVYGGGWNKGDSGAGSETRKLGASPLWEKFFLEQGSDYDFKNHRYEIHNGLDCSAYVGFCIYNALMCRDGERGFVTQAKNMGKMLSRLGFGEVLSKNCLKAHLCGDIMFNESHTYITLCECEDKSLLLVHSSPVGVQLNGTVTPEKDEDSLAVKFASSFMNKHFPRWTEKYSVPVKNVEYLTDYDCFRWFTDKKGVFTDKFAIKSLAANEVMKLLL